MTQKKQKGSVVVWLIIIAIIIAGGAYYYSQRTTISPETEIEEADQFADWQTYTNEEYGFEVKYPGDWEMLLEDGKDKNIDQNMFIRPKLSQGDFPVAMYISRRTIEEELAYIKDNMLKESFLEILGEKDIIVNESVGKEILYINSLIKSTESESAKIVIFGLDNGSYSISGFDDYFDQILSTFKFID